MESWRANKRDAEVGSFDEKFTPMAEDLVLELLETAHYLFQLFKTRDSDSLYAYINSLDLFINRQKYVGFYQKMNG